VRLAHASDLHLLSLAGARVLDFANKRWIGGLNLLTNRGRHHKSEIFEAMIEDLNAGNVDHLLITGDLTNLAFEAEFRFARELFNRLALGADAITVIPGSHDAYVAEGIEHFAAHFEDFATSDPGWEWPDGSRWPLVRVRGPVAIVGLSTSHETPWFTAYGQVGELQLERARTALSDPRLAGCFRILAIHHAPAGPPAQSRIRGLRDRAALAAMLSEVGCELVLHGHEHRDLSAELAGPGGLVVPVRGIQSGTYEAGNPAKRARYRVYDIADGQGGRAVQHGEDLRVYDPAGHRFATEVFAVAPAEAPAAPPDPA
jgi:3',5'-cyclic AMP phosphodiesterase CpdA